MLLSSQRLDISVLDDEEFMRIDEETVLFLICAAEAVLLHQKCCVLRPIIELVYTVPTHEDEKGV